MLLVGCDMQATETACLLAARLSERNPLSGQGIDIAPALAVLTGESRCPAELQGWCRRTREQARRFRHIAGEIHKPSRSATSVAREDVAGILLASAYPDRIARLRKGGDGCQYQLSNGRSAVLPAADTLAGGEWLAVAEIGGQLGGAADRIHSACRLNPACFGEILSSQVREEEQVKWDYRREQLVAERRAVVGSIVLSARPLRQISPEAQAAVLLGVVRRKGLDILPWSHNLRQWRARVMLLRRAGGDRWPDLSDQALLDSLEEWLLPYLDGVRRLQDFSRLDLRAILHSLVPWPLALELEQLAPERLAVPSGSSIAIDYSREPPVLAVKLQEMFGCEETPAIANGRISLVVHLLSPAGRPLQITRDLAGFWRSGYQAVRREMKGRYPKHPWPDDPLQATATRHTNRRAEQG
jgi:ATP-dependent helicase HrpB